MIDAMETWDFVGWQYGMTAILVLAIAIFMLMRVRRSQQKRGEHAGDVVVGERPAETADRRR
jgi:hypothetical protein